MRLTTTRYWNDTGNIQTVFSLFVMNNRFLQLLSHVCGVEAEYPPTETDLFYRMFLLMRYFAKTPSNLWWASERENLIGPRCSTCGCERNDSIVQSHSLNCIFLPLCRMTNPDDKSRIKTYLKTNMNSIASRKVVRTGIDTLFSYGTYVKFSQHVQQFYVLAGRYAKNAR